MKIGMIGGTGIEGKGLALRFAASGFEVMVGSRSAAKASAAAESYNKELGREVIVGVPNVDLLGSSDLLFLTAPADSALSAVEACRARIPAGTILVDVTVPMIFRSGHAEYAGSEGLSNSERIAAALPPEVRVVCAFKTIPAHLLVDLEVSLDCDVFVCSDDGAAKEKVMAASARIPELRPLDAGGLKMAGILERMTVLAVHLNRRYKRKHSRYRVVGM